MLAGDATPGGGNHLQAWLLRALRQQRRNKGPAHPVCWKAWCAAVARVREGGGVGAVRDLTRRLLRDSGVLAQDFDLGAPELLDAALTMLERVARGVTAEAEAEASVLALTATPIQNRITDVLALLRLVLGCSGTEAALRELAVRPDAREVLATLGIGGEEEEEEGEGEGEGEGRGAAAPTNESRPSQLARLLAQVTEEEAEAGANAGRLPTGPAQVKRRPSRPDEAAAEEAPDPETQRALRATLATIRRLRDMVALGPPPAAGSATSGDGSLLAHSFKQVVKERHVPMSGPEVEAYQAVTETSENGLARLGGQALATHGTSTLVAYRPHKRGRDGSESVASAASVPAEAGSGGGDDGSGGLRRSASASAVAVGGAAARRRRTVTEAELMQRLREAGALGSTSPAATTTACNTMFNAVERELRALRVGEPLYTDAGVDTGRLVRAVVFVRFRAAAILLEAHLKQKGMVVARVSSDASQADQSTQLGLWDADAARAPPAAHVLVAVSESASEGRNLSWAQHLLVVGAWWNPTQAQQMAGRVARPGQAPGVCLHIVHMVAVAPEHPAVAAAGGTVTQQMLRVQAAKQVQNVGAGSELGYGPAPSATADPASISTLEEQVAETPPVEAALPQPDSLHGALVTWGTGRGKTAVVLLTMALGTLTGLLGVPRSALHSEAAADDVAAVFNTELTQAELAAGQGLGAGALGRPLGPPVAETTNGSRKVRLPAASAVAAPVVVVMPASIIAGWVQTVRRLMPWPVMCLGGVARRRHFGLLSPLAARAAAGGQPPLVVVAVTTLSPIMADGGLDAEVLRSAQLVALDEAHHLRNRDTGWWLAARALIAQHHAHQAARRELIRLYVRREDARAAREAARRRHATAQPPAPAPAPAPAPVPAPAPASTLEAALAALP